MKKLPIDVSTFKTLISQNYLYIDKTKLIYDIFLKEGRYFFLSRPRRFGKSLLISTLQEIFAGNRFFFENLWISKENAYRWEKHPVIHLNFSALDIETSQELKISLSWTLETIADSHQIDISQAPSPGKKLELLVRRLAERNSVVILIDEYDYPLINNLDNSKIAEANRKVLKNFFSVVKSLDEHLRAIFITGVSKFSKTSIFSGLNNLNDLSLDPIAASLLGYTQEEINFYFSKHISKMAQDKNAFEGDIKKEIQAWYNGYRFSEKELTVCNPFSVLYLFKKEKFANYWFESGTPSFLIQLLSKQYEALENIEEIELSSASLGTFDIGDLPVITILFQTGYLTIHDYDSLTHKYKLSYPNAEVRHSFKQYLLAAFSQSDISTVERAVSNF